MNRDYLLIFTTETVLADEFVEFGEGPVFLDGVNCFGNESNLTSCPTFYEFGVHACYKGSEAIVKCGGETHTCDGVVVDFVI